MIRVMKIAFLTQNDWKISHGEAFVGSLDIFDRPEERDRVGALASGGFVFVRRNAEKFLAALDSGCSHTKFITTSLPSCRQFAQNGTGRWYGSFHNQCHT